MNVNTNRTTAAPGTAASCGQKKQEHAGETFEEQSSSSNGTRMQLALPFWFETGSIIVLTLIIVADLVLAYKRPHVPSVRESSLWVAFYVSLALVFALLMLWLGDAAHAGQFLAGWLTEYSLSVDNLFVFATLRAVATRTLPPLSCGTTLLRPSTESPGKWPTSSNTASGKLATAATSPKPRCAHSIPSTPSSLRK